MPDLSHLKVGDTVWWVPRRGEGLAVSVEEVGRSWLYLRRPFGRIRRKDGSTEKDGWDRAFLSREAYETELADRETWEAFLRAMRNMWRRPGHLDAARIREIAAMIGVTL